MLKLSSTTFMPKKCTTYRLLCEMASFLKFDKWVTILLLDPVIGVCGLPWAKNSSSFQMAYAFHVCATVLVHVARRRRLYSDLDDRSLWLQPMIFSNGTILCTFSECTLLCNSLIWFYVSLRKKCFMYFVFSNFSICQFFHTFL